tara:strand:+ start:257 stop:367 length:111 start_codon:yes stop_codon:yes gene_type:complete
MVTVENYRMGLGGVWIIDAWIIDVWIIDAWIIDCYI